MGEREVSLGIRNVAVTWSQKSISGRGATCGGARAKLWLAPDLSDGDLIHPVSPRWRQGEGQVQLIDEY